jgi:hypothetical protein
MGDKLKISRYGMSLKCGPRTKADKRFEARIQRRGEKIRKEMDQIAADVFLESPALKRLIEEVRAGDGAATGYNRTYHRHNR